MSNDLPPLVKYGQGRDEHESGPLTPIETFKNMETKLRAAGYAEPALPKTLREEMEERRVAGLAEQETPIVSRSGFRAGVLSAVMGGCVFGGIFTAWGVVPAGLFAALCVGFVGGMILTQDWE